MVVPWGKTNFSQKTYVLKFLAIQFISYFFIYKFMTYHWKGLEKRYNSVVGSISIIT
jgi:hypothetical protein